MGGTGIAQPHGSDSAFLNPAGISYFSEVHATGGYRYGKTAIGNVKQFHAVIMDSNEENIFKGAIAYRERKYESALFGDAREKDFIANGAYQINPNLSVGLRGYKKQTDIPLESIDQYNGDLGAHWIVVKDFALAITQFGMFSTKDSVVQPLGVLPMTTVGALYVIPDIVVFTADLAYAYKENDRDRFSHAVGVGFINVEFFRTNFGARFDDRAGEAYYSAGFQFAGPRLKIGYAYQKESRKDLGEVHTFDISVNL